MAQLTLHLSSSRLAKTPNGHTIWIEQAQIKQAAAERTAIIVCDMWDNHWSSGAARRVDEMAHRMNDVLTSAREKGVQIIHAPSDTLNFYKASPARERMLALPAIEPPSELAHVNPPLPIDDSDEGSDSGETETYRAWNRQHAAIHIDESRDGLSDDGREIYSFLQHHKIEQLLIMGVHTNMCVLNRSFGIKQIVRWGVDIALVRDLTDTMYNPAMPPYVSHDEGTQLVVGYIEKFWCPSVLSTDLG